MIEISTCGARRHHRPGVLRDLERKHLALIAAGLAYTLTPGSEEEFVEVLRMSRVPVFADESTNK